MRSAARTPNTTRVVTTSARLRPTRSENQPPVVAPMNMPTNDAEVMVLIVSIDRCHCLAHARRGEREAVQVAELEEEDVGEQLDDVAVEAGDGQPIEPRGRRRPSRGRSAAHLVRLRRELEQGRRPIEAVHELSVRQREKQPEDETEVDERAAAASRAGRASASSSRPVALVMNSMTMNDSSSPRLRRDR